MSCPSLSSRIILLSRVPKNSRSVMNYPSLGSSFMLTLLKAHAIHKVDILIYKGVPKGGVEARRAYKCWGLPLLSLIPIKVTLSQEFYIILSFKLKLRIHNIKMNPMRFCILALCFSLFLFIP